MSDWMLAMWIVWCSNLPVSKSVEMIKLTTRLDWLTKRERESSCCCWWWWWWPTIIEFVEIWESVVQIVAKWLSLSNLAHPLSELLRADQRSYLRCHGLLLLLPGHDDIVCFFLASLRLFLPQLKQILTLSQRAIRDLHCVRGRYIIICTVFCKGSFSICAGRCHAHGVRAALLNSTVYGGDVYDALRWCWGFGRGRQWVEISKLVQ